MKTIVSNDQVAHLFANAAQDRASNANNSLSFRVERVKKRDYLVLYSYATPIAFRLYKTAIAAIFITDKSYSPTTGEHLVSLRRAASHQSRLEVPGAERGQSGWVEKLVTYSAFKKYLRDYFTEKEKLVRANRSSCAARHLLTKLDDADRAMRALHSKNFVYKVGKLTSEMAVAYDTKVRIQRERNAARDADRAAKRELESIIEMRERLPGWLAGEHSSLPYHRAAYLRVKSDGVTVQTSHGAEVPLGMAIAFYERLLAGEAREGQHVGAFSISALLADEVVIGCHTIKRSEMARLYELIKSPAVLEEAFHGN